MLISPILEKVHFLRQQVAINKTVQPIFSKREKYPQKISFYQGWYIKSATIILTLISAMSV